MKLLIVNLLLLVRLKELLHQENFENVGFEGHHVSYDTYLELNKAVYH